MDKRFFLALLLTAIVIVAPPLFLNRGARRPAGVADSTKPILPRLDSTTATPSAPTATTTSPAMAPSVQGALTAPAAPAETTTVQTRRTRYAFSTRGAAPISVVLDSYPSRRPTTADPKVLARDRKPPSEL